MLDLSEITVADCQQYLLNVCDPDQAPFLDQPTLNDKDLHEIVSFCKSWTASNNGKNIQRSADEMETIPKYTALLLSTILNTSSSDGKPLE
jgi:hypothetical protein